MIKISYALLVVLISFLWLLSRFLVWRKQGFIHWKRELALLFVYVCIVVVARFTFFPFSKVNGQIQPLVFDPAQVFPPRVNLLPIVYLLDYPEQREALLNLIGNTAMFVPLGIVWPIVYSRLNTPLKAIGAGFGFSLFIEILQLPFYDRVSDIDDLILNTTGFIIGYVLYRLVKAMVTWLAKRLAT